MHFRLIAVRLYSMVQVWQPRRSSDQPSGSCLTCRYIKSELVRYTAEPWWHSYDCTKMYWGTAPHVENCPYYEREPGAD
jgi:hypothetical protein